MSNEPDDVDASTDATDPNDLEDGEEPTPSIFTGGRRRLRRRTVAKGLATAGGVTAAASLAAPVASLTKVFEREYTGPIYGEEIALVDEAGEQVPEDALAVGERMTVFPEPRPGLAEAPTILVRNEEDAYTDETALEHTAGGYAAFSKVCTHLSCMVSDGDASQFVCPCHYAEFNALGGASVTGGPAPRPLPQLPLTVSSDGYLIATGDFLEPVGGE